MLRALERLELGESRWVGQRGVERVLGGFLGGEVCVLARGVGVPPGEGRGFLQRLDRLLMAVDELAGRVGLVGRVAAALDVDTRAEAPTSWAVPTRKSRLEGMVTDIPDGQGFSRS